ncbi:YcxB family protein [bacterium]|nr:MAG: YcxB family protein [bacterium]
MITTVTFTLDLDDFDALTKVVEKKSMGSALWFVYWVVPFAAIALGLIPLLTLWMHDGLIPSNGNWLSTYGSAIFWLFVGSTHRVANAWARRRFRKSPHFGTQAQINLEEKGVLALTHGGETLLYWKSILRLEETPTHFFLFIAPKQAFIVPKRAFAAPAEAQEFVALAQAWWQKNHPVPVTPPLAAP